MMLIHLCTFLIGMSFGLSPSMEAEMSATEVEQTVASPSEKASPYLGLHPIPWPEDNPYTKEKAELGRTLYFDTRLSANNTVSCATCHNIPCAFSDCRPLAVGIDKRHGTRHSPTIINSAYLKHLFWDGRVNSLEEQVKGPIANTKEMALNDNVHEAHRYCVLNIKNIEGYRRLFKQVFGHDEISIDDIAKAIATFERTVVSGNSPYDRYIHGDKTVMSQQQIRGLEIFKKSGCMNCHAGFNFSDERFLNIGIGMANPNPDLGRYSITDKDSDWGAFKVPTLRDIEHTGPYMHDGSLKTLEEVIDYYDMGGTPNKNLHPLMHPLKLTSEDKKALVSFLKALSGEGWQHFHEPSSFPQ